MVLIAALTGLLAILCVNGWALYVGKGRHTALYDAASVFGALGLVSVVIFLIASLDAFLQIWATRPGYEGMPVIYSFWAVVLFSSISFVVAVAVAWQSRQAKA